MFSEGKSRTIDQKWVYYKNFEALFMNEVQLPQGYKATMRRQFSFDQ